MAKTKEIEDKVEITENEFTVGDPLIFKPVELPLVVTPANGAWKNPQQEEYAKTVNAYAYKNPTKWSQNRIDINGQEIPNSSKKAVLLQRLKEIGENPSKLNIYNGGGDGNIKFSNKLINS